MRSWFYKDGKGKIFEDGIMPEGWTDHPLGMSADIIAAQEAKDAGLEVVEEKPAPKTKRKYTKKVKPEVEE